MRRSNFGIAAVITVATITLCGAAPAQADDVRVQSTFDTIDAGLVVGLLDAAYKQAQPGDTLKYVGNGTGAALDKARNGEADVVVTHAPSLEKKFVDEGYSIDGRAIFYSDYVIIGPPEDPAGVLSGAPHDAITAFEKIAAAGAAGTATFVSRKDNSGTNTQEEIMWGMTGDAVPKTVSTRAANRFTPGTTASPAPWYATGSNGQGDNVLRTEACAPASYPQGACYTMVDRGTYNNLVNAGTVTKLKVLADKNTPNARGGENLLVNPFSAYLVNPDKFADDKKPNVAAGRRFLDFLVSESFQDALLGFPSAASPAFFPDAFAKVDAVVPAVVVRGGTVALNLTVSDRLPGGGAIAGQPVQLQASTDGGSTFADVGPAVETDAAGKVSFAPSLSATTTYRAALPRYKQFTGKATVLGVVAAQTVVEPTPSPTPVAKPIDKTAPTVSKVTLTSKKLTFSLTEGSTVKVTVALKTTKKVKGRSKTTYATKKRLTIKATKSGTATKTFGALKPGVYRVTIQATDAAGNKKTKTSVITIKAAKKAKAKG